MSYIKNQNGFTWLLGLIIVLALAGGGFYLYTQNQADNDREKSTGEEKSMANKENTEDAIVNEVLMEKKDEVMIKDEAKIPGDSPQEDKKMMADEIGAYLAYTGANYENNQNRKRILFFHASWCPTCRAANAEFEANLDKLPAGVVLLKTDYDSQTELKKKYGITYQHTFVLVDAQGNALKKWNGGGLDELIANTR